MTLRTWALFIVVVCAIAAVAGGRPAHERSEHSRPANHVRDASVIVTDKGKLFHRPGCKYMHGAPKTISTEEAEREGYTPCTRCFRDAMETQ